MENEKLRCAILGVGAFTPKRGGVNAIAYAHAEAIKRNGERFELVAACTRTAEHLDDFRREYPCRGYRDYRMLLAQEEIDFAVVSTYATDREEHVGAVIRAGVKYILVEKPFTLNVGAARRLAVLAEAYGARLFVDFQRRYGEPFEQALAAVESGRIGVVNQIEISQPCPNLWDFGPHLINLALYFSGGRAWRRAAAVADWSGGGSWQGIETERELDGVVYLDGDLRWSVSASDDNSAGRPAIRINGDRGMIELRLCPIAGEGGVFRLLSADGDGIEVPALEENFHHGNSDPYRYFEKCYADLGNVIPTGGPCRIDLDEALATQEILSALYRSSRIHRPVSRDDEELDSEFTRTQIAKT